MNPDLPNASRQFFIYADNDPDSVILMRLALRKLNTPVSVVDCEDGAGFINLLSNTLENSLPLPMFALLDLKMPEVDGLETLRWLRSKPELRHLQAYIFSSSASQTDMEQSFSSGADDYIVKPTGLDELRQQLMRLLSPSGITVMALQNATAMAS
jgi:CheY-like chemotaxis protein